MLWYDAAILMKFWENVWSKQAPSDSIGRPTAKFIFMLITLSYFSILHWNYHQ